MSDLDSLTDYFLALKERGYDNKTAQELLDHAAYVYLGTEKPKRMNAPCSLCPAPAVHTVAKDLRGTTVNARFCDDHYLLYENSLGVIEFMQLHYVANIGVAATALPSALTALAQFLTQIGDDESTTPEERSMIRQSCLSNLLHSTVDHAGLFFGIANDLAAAFKAGQESTTKRRSRKKSD